MNYPALRQGQAKRLRYSANPPEACVKEAVMSSIEGNLEQRVADLERQLAEARRLRGRLQRLSAVLALAGVGAVTIAANLQPEVPQVLQARRIEVVDEQGHVVVAAAASEAGGQIDVWNADHINVARLWVNAHGGDLAIWNRAGQNVFGAFAGADGGEVGIWDAKGSPALRGHARPDGGVFTVHNAAGTAVVTAGNDKQGAGAIKVSDARGLPRFTAAVDQAGGQTRLLGGDGKPLVVSGAAGTGGGGFVEIFNGQGARVCTTAAGGAGGGRLDLADAAGTVILTADAANDAAALAVTSDTGDPVFAISKRSQGGLMSLMNGAGQTVCIAGAADEGMGGALAIKNGSGRQVLHAGYDSESDGLVTVWDAVGQSLEMLSPKQ
jgi:hypothetical protein